ncbi:MAG: hypothetical protein E4H13_04235 [Calditrichales bacterium]|nr:MAG: hypothetical protein E4H13_04235 [Calditrichales bacterium]
MKQLLSAISMALLLFMLNPASVPPALAGANEPPANDEVPKLNGVTIYPNNLIPNPFIKTYLRNSLGFGTTTPIQLQFSQFDQVESTITFGALYYALLELDYQYAVQDWMAVWFRYRFAARLGSDIGTILSQGISTFNSFNMGWLVHIWSNDSHFLSANLELINSAVTIIDLLSYVKKSVEEGQLSEDTEIIYTAPVLLTAVSLRYTTAFKKMYALTAQAQLAYGEAILRSQSNKFYNKFGLTVQADLQVKYHVPLGVTLGLSKTTLPDVSINSAGNTSTFLISATYIGRKDFTFSLDLTMQNTKIRGLDNEIKYYAAVLSMQYFL